MAVAFAALSGSPPHQCHARFHSRMRRPVSESHRQIDIQIEEVLSLEVIRRVAEGRPMSAFSRPALTPDISNYFRSAMTFWWSSWITNIAWPKPRHCIFHRSSTRISLPSTNRQRSRPFSMKRRNVWAKPCISGGNAQLRCRLPLRPVRLWNWHYSEVDRGTLRPQHDIGGRPPGR